MSVSSQQILAALSPSRAGFPVHPGLTPTDKKILVHGVASVNRSSLLIGCILHRFLGLRGEELIRSLEEKSGGYAILTNRKFREYLSSLGHEL